MIKILFVCHGNICRSPMAQYYFQNLIEEKHLSHLFYVDSAATSTEEIGNPVHPGTRRRLAAAGIPCGGHKARQMTRQDYKDFDYLIAWTAGTSAICAPSAAAIRIIKIYKLLDFTDKSRDVADPWYTGDFEATFQDVSRGCAGLLEHCRKSR